MKLSIRKYRSYEEINSTLNAIICYILGLDNYKKMFFVTSSPSSPATLTDPRLIDHEVLKIENSAGGSSLFEGVQFTKTLSASTITMISPSVIMPNTKYLITLA